MLPTTDQLLTQMEAAVDEVANALVGSDADLLQQASEQLRLSATAVAQLVAQLPPQRRDAALRNRVQRVQARMLDQRAGLARHSARTEHALHALVPGARNDTYGKAASRYGSGLKQTGAFKVLAA